MKGPSGSFFITSNKQEAVIELITAFLFLEGPPDQPIQSHIPTNTTHLVYPIVLTRGKQVAVPTMKKYSPTAFSDFLIRSGYGRHHRNGVSILKRGNVAVCHHGPAFV